MPIHSRKCPDASITFLPLPDECNAITLIDNRSIGCSRDWPLRVYLTLEYPPGHPPRETHTVCREKWGCVGNKAALDEIGNVHGHLLDLSAVELLDFSHHANILGRDEVDGYTLSAETTTTTNAVDIVLPVRGQIIVDD